MSSFVPGEADYKPRNILITGGAGFIASHVCILLAKKYPQCNIINFDRLDYCSCLENLDEIKDLPNYKFIKGRFLLCLIDALFFLHVHLLIR